MQISRCPLCGMDLGKQEVVNFTPTTADIFQVDCPRCGRYDVTEEAIDLLEYQQDFDQERHIFSGYTREKSDLGVPRVLSTRTHLSTRNLPQIAHSHEIPREVLDKLDKLIQAIARRSNYPGDVIVLQRDNDYPLAYARGPEEIGYLLEHLEERNFISSVPQRSGPRWSKEGQASVTLTVDGWERFEELERRRPSQDQAFIAMWFDPELDEAYEQGICKGIEDAGYKPVRVDLVEHNEKICDRIIAEIRRSKFLVADFTGHRQGVYFEAGFAMALDLPVIWLCRGDHMDATHFDTRQYNHVVWETPEDLYTKLLNRIEATIT